MIGEIKTFVLRNYFQAKDVLQKQEESGNWNEVIYVEQKDEEGKDEYIVACV